MNRTPQRRGLPCGWSSDPRGAAGYRPVVRFHRRLSRRNRGGFCGDARTGRRTSVSHRPSSSNIRRGPERPAPILPIRCPKTSRPNGSLALQDWSKRSDAPSTRSMVGRTFDVLFEKPGRHPGQIGGKSPYLQAVHVDGPERLIGQVAAVEIIDVSSNSLFGRLAAALGRRMNMALADETPRMATSKPDQSRGCRARRN